MNKKYLGLTTLGVGVLAGVLWFASLDKETRGLLGALPTDRDLYNGQASSRDLLHEGLFGVGWESRLRSVHRFTNIAQGCLGFERDIEFGDYRRGVFARK